METHIYNLTDEPSGPVYRRLLEISTAYCGTFLLVKRHTIAMDETAESALEALRPFIKEVHESSEWPGTQLLGGTATVYQYHLSEKAVVLLGEMAQGLFSWVQPYLPEDLCLLRANGEPWIVSISHESDGYLKLSASEKEALTQKVPDLRLEPYED
jgi:hypothetical protein